CLNWRDVTVPILSKLQQKQKTHRRYFVTPVLLALALAVLLWPVHIITFAHHEQAQAPWQSHNLDLLFVASYSQKEQPDGPLVVYRAVGGDLRHVVPVVTVPRGPVVQTPVLFPSPDGRYVALLNPLMMRYASNLNGATLSVLSTDGRPFAPVESRRPLLNTGGSPASARTLALHVASAGQVI